MLYIEQKKIVNIKYIASNKQIDQKAIWIISTPTAKFYKIRHTIIIHS